MEFIFIPIISLILWLQHGLALLEKDFDQMELAILAQKEHIFLLLQRFQQIV